MRRNVENFLDTREINNIISFTTLFLGGIDVACLEITDKILTDTELINLYKVTKDQYYLLELYNKHIRLLNKLAWKYSNINYLYTYEDLQNETYLALAEAAEKYDPKMCQFSTFLFVVTNQRLYAIVNGKSSKEQNNKILNDCISIYTIIGDGEDDTILLDTIEDEVAQEMIDNLPEIMFIADLRAAEEEAISKLTPKQKLVVEAVNGFNSEIYKEVELASYMGISPGRISEIINNAYRKLRHDDQLRKIFFEEFHRS